MNLKQVDEIEDRYDLWQNYRKSTNRANASCKKVSEEETVSEEVSNHNFGVLMVIDAEEAAMNLQEPVEMQAAISEALDETGFTTVHTQTAQKKDGYELLFFLQEGYVAARTWPKHHYCAYDVLLWKGMEKQDTAKAQLAAAINSKYVSSYRVITGGMLGSVSSKEEETTNVGPRITQPCDTPSVLHTTVQHAPTTQGILDQLLSKSASFIQGSHVVVLCGDQSNPCNSLKVLARKEKQVVPIWTCPSLLQEVVPPDMMLECKRDVLATLKEVEGRLGGVVIDQKAPRSMGQVLHKLFSSQHRRRDLLEESYAVLSLSEEPVESSWRRALLDRFLTNFSRYDQAYHADVLFNESYLELEVFYSGSDSFYSNLMNVVGSVESVTGLTADIRNIKSSLNNYVADFEPSMTASHDDYDHNAARQQWKSQQALAKQALVQFEVEQKEPLNTTATKEVLRTALMNTNDDDDGRSIEVYDDVCDGAIIVGSWSLGRAILTWDGRTTLTANLLSDKDVSVQLERDLEKHFTLTVSSRDEMPRGIGRVVNYLSADEKLAAPPHWVA